MTTKKFYLTTPIYYPNDIPHLGHAYTTIAADALARWHRLLGDRVFFLTGTDEHGKKIARTAEKAGKTPEQFTDALVPEFKKTWQTLDITYDRFIRTTDLDHTEVVQYILKKVNANNDIYKGIYEGFYCTECEAYYTEIEAPGSHCPIHKKPLETLKEESYFFRLSKYQSFLLDLYEKNPEFISPKNRKQEIINRVEEGLKDFSISRTSFTWGIPLPFDKKHITYVWFDALINYLSGIGFLKDKKQFGTFWPVDVHIIGKDILWFHVVYWPAMLKSAGIELPEKVFAHGFLTVHNEKIGKSAGNAISIQTVIGYAGVDAARYFLLRSTPFGDDGDFSEKTLKERYNNELANKLGNLVARTTTLAEKYGIQKVRVKTLSSITTQVNLRKYFDRLEFDKALAEIFAYIDRCNRFIQTKKPWETKDKKVLYELCNALKDIAILLSPFIPETAQKIAETINTQITFKNLKEPLAIKKIRRSEILFKKI